MGEDGLAGVQRHPPEHAWASRCGCFRDAFLKERLFGLTRLENSSEDVKEHWWYTDAVPSHALNTWHYHYPQAPFPYDDLRAESARRDRRTPEYEILDTGIFDQDRYWVTEVSYAKSDDAACALRRMLVDEQPARTPGHDPRAADRVVPLLTWSWDGSMKPNPADPGRRC